MPTYPVIHKETREKKELSMTMKEYDQWRKDNPEWDKDWQAGVAATQEMLSGQERQHPLVGMKCWIEHPSNQVQLS